MVGNTAAKPTPTRPTVRTICTILCFCSSDICCVRPACSAWRSASSPTSTFDIATIPTPSETSPIRTNGSNARGLFDMKNIASAGCFFTLLCLRLQVAMRVLAIILLTAGGALGQDVDLQIRPEAIYVENIGGNIVPLERVFFHIVLENKSGAPIEIQWLRFDMVNSEGVVLSGQS